MEGSAAASRSWAAVAKGNVEPKSHWQTVCAAETASSKKVANRSRDSSRGGTKKAETAKPPKKLAQTLGGC